MRTAGAAIIGYTMNRTGTITGGGLRVDSADATRTYNLEIYVNGVLAATLLLGLSTLFAFSTSLSIAIVAGDHVELYLARASGGGASTFSSVSAWFEATV